MKKSIQKKSAKQNKSAPNPTRTLSTGIPAQQTPPPKRKPKATPLRCPHCGKAGKLAVWRTIPLANPVGERRYYRCGHCDLCHVSTVLREDELTAVEGAT